MAQSLSRQCLARREVKKRRMSNMNKAACKIQATWRGFQGYTDYIFALVDILVLQRSMRKWLARSKVEGMRRTRAAIKIQAQWRRQTALIGMLYDLVHIIIVQVSTDTLFSRCKHAVKVAICSTVFPAGFLSIECCQKVSDQEENRAPQAQRIFTQDATAAEIRFSGNKNTNRMARFLGLFAFYHYAI